MSKFLISFVISVICISSFAFAGGYAQSIEYTVGNKQFSAFSVSPKIASKGNVYIIHDWDGLIEYERKRTEMLAGLGFNAVA
jgi:dienelactone hydrolase